MIEVGGTYFRLSGVVKRQHTVVVSRFSFDGGSDGTAKLSNTDLAVPVPRIHVITGWGGKLISPLVNFKDVFFFSLSFQIELSWQLFALLTLMCVRIFTSTFMWRHLKQTLDSFLNCTQKSFFLFKCTFYPTALLLTSHLTEIRNTSKLI